MPKEICKANENLYVLYWLRFRLFLDSIDSFFSYPNIIHWNDKA